MGGLGLVSGQSCGRTGRSAAGSPARRPPSSITGEPPPHPGRRLDGHCRLAGPKPIPPLSSVASCAVEAGDLTFTFSTFLDVIFVLPTRCFYIRLKSRTKIRVEWNMPWGSDFCLCVLTWKCFEVSEQLSSWLLDPSGTFLVTVRATALVRHDLRFVFSPWKNQTEVSSVYKQFYKPFTVPENKFLSVHIIWGRFCSL